MSLAGWLSTLKSGKRKEREMRFKVGDIVNSCGSTSGPHGRVEEVSQARGAVKLRWPDGSSGWWEEDRIKLVSEGTMKYKKPDGCTYSTTFGELRKWAEECSQVKEWMEKHLPKGVFEKAGRTYEVGQRFIIEKTAISDGEYILATNGDGQRMVMLISLADGCAWRKPLQVKNIDAITEDEMEGIAGTTYPWKLKE